MRRFRVTGINTEDPNVSGWGTGGAPAGPWVEYIDAPDADAAVRIASARNVGSGPVIRQAQEVGWNSHVTLIDRLRRWFRRFW